MSVLGVILAGGRSSRMGAEKALVLLAGRPMLAHVIDRFAPQVDALVLNANGDPARFAAFGLPVIPDPLPDRPGPLAGVLAGLAEAEARGFAAIVTVPADAPFLPVHLVAGLRSAAFAAGTDAALAEGEGPEGPRAHPVMALWPVTAAPAIRARLVAGDNRVGAALAALNAARILFADPADDPFDNVNTPEDLARAARRLSP